MGYSIYLDSNHDFKCKLKLEGSSISKAKPRLVVNSPSLDFSLIFEGHILPNTGQCIIPIPRLRSILQEGDVGTLQLEVIAEGDTYFQAWTDEFKALYKKKAIVSEVVSEKGNTKNNQQIIVEFDDINLDQISNQLFSELKMNGIHLQNIAKHANKVNSLVSEICDDHGLNLSSDQVTTVIDKTIKLFS